MIVERNHRCNPKLISYSSKNILYRNTWLRSCFHMQASVQYQTESHDRITTIIYGI